MGPSVGGETKVWIYKNEGVKFGNAPQNDLIHTYNPITDERHWTKGK